MNDPRPLVPLAPESIPSFDLSQAVKDANANYFDNPDLLDILKRCRVHVGIRAIEGKGDSRELVTWLDAEIAKRGSGRAYNQRDDK